MALLERLAILITADAAGAISEMKKLADSAEKDLAKAGDAGKGFSGTMTKVGAAMVGAGAGLLAVGLSAASSTTELGREVIKLQRYTGATAEEASKLRFAAKMSGVDVDTLAQGLGKLSKSMEAGSPAFDKLGLSARDSAGHLKSMGEFLPELSDKLKEMPNGAEKSALMLQLFGRNGMAMLPFLNKGAEGIKQLSDEAEKMGLVLTQDNIGAITDNIRAQRELGAAFDGIKTKIGLQMMPILTGFTNLVKGIPGPVLDIIGPLVVFGGVGLTAAGAIGMLIGQLNNLKPAFLAISVFAAENPLTAWIVGIGAALAVVAIAFAAFGNHESATTKLTKEYADAMRDGTDATEKFTTQKIQDALASKHLTDAALAAGLGVSQLTDIIKDGGEELHAYAVDLADAYAGVRRTEAFTTASAAIQSFDASLANAFRTNAITGEQVVKIAQEVDKQATAYRAAKAQQDALDAAQQTYTSNVSLLEQAQNAAADATVKHTEAAKKLDEALRNTFNPIFGMVDANNKIAEGQRDVADATDKVAEKTKALNEARKTNDATKIAAAERELADAQQRLNEANINATKNAMDFQKAQNDLLASLKDNPKALEDARAKVEEYGRQGLINAEQMKIMKQAIADAAAQAMGFPSELDMKITLNTWGFWSNITAVERYLDSMTPEQRAAAAATIAGVIPRASGGRVGPGMALGGRPDARPYLVGELGPELFVPDTSGTVITAENTAKMLGGGGTTIVQNFAVEINTVAGDPVAIERVVLDAIGRANVRGMTALVP